MRNYGVFTRVKWCRAQPSAADSTSAKRKIVLLLLTYGSGAELTYQLQNSNPKKLLFCSRGGVARSLPTSRRCQKYKGKILRILLIWRSGAECTHQLQMPRLMPKENMNKIFYFCSLAEWRRAYRPAADFNCIKSEIAKFTQKVSDSIWTRLTSARSPNRSE